MSDRFALVTGAGSGLGQAVAEGLAAAGWQVILTGRRRDKLDAVAQRIGSMGGQAIAIESDVGDSASVDCLFGQTIAHFGRIDLLLNNAGIFTPSAPIGDVTDGHWLDSVQTNLTGAFFCTRAAFRQMRNQTPRGGRIINNGSISASVPRPNSAPYAATKAGLTGLTRATALDGRAYDIACGQIDIGNAETEMTRAFAHGPGALQADGTRKAEAVMDARHVVNAVVYMAGLPLDANVLFMTVAATKMPFIGRG